MNSCQGIRADLASCLLESDCVQKDGRSGQECLRDHMDELDMECKNIYKSYVHCKRGMLNMAKRFRGNAPPTAKGNKPQGGVSEIESALSPDYNATATTQQQQGQGQAHS